MFEPRGHPDMYGGYVVESVSTKADFGVIFIHNEGYSDHCGHGVIALSSTAVKLGWVERTIPETKVCIDAPCGFIEAYVAWDGKNVGRVKFTNVPSFIWLENAAVETPTFGKVTGDIAFGGAFYFYMNSKYLDLPVKLSEVETLKKLGNEVKVAANIKYKVKHPQIPELNHIYGTIISNEPNTEGATEANICIFADRQVDRSPTGSGTAGKVATLFLKNKIKKDEYIYNESIIGSIFKAKVVEKTKLANFDAAIPEVEGSAHILGYANWTIDENDDLGKGFLVRD